ncbi:unnamed protein product [Protopolystoma xenopodis]|uniref:Amino acid transporter transmembrane domain-containing protein n=1 Tax=Protopolystoma xenopodis TaxID=117903 RepID=A0A3S5AEI9_9PLAT|nr:unnamed protein product [Protopolystoma xenopodis]
MLTAIIINAPLTALFFALQLGCALVTYAVFAGCDPIKHKDISKPDQLLPFMVMTVFENYYVIKGIFLSTIYAAALRLEDYS